MMVEHYNFWNVIWLQSALMSCFQSTNNCDQQKSHFVCVLKHRIQTHQNSEFNIKSWVRLKLLMRLLSTNLEPQQCLPYKQENSCTCKISPSSGKGSTQQRTTTSESVLHGLKRILISLSLCCSRSLSRLFSVLL